MLGFRVRILGFRGLGFWGCGVGGSGLRGSGFSFGSSEPGGWLGVVCVCVCVCVCVSVRGLVWVFDFSQGLQGTLKPNTPKLSPKL